MQVFKLDIPRYCLICDAWRMWVYPKNICSCCWNPTMSVKEYEETTNEKVDIEKIIGG